MYVLLCQKKKKKIRCNQVPISTSHLPRVNSSLIKDAWEFYLLDYPDKQFVTSLLHIIDHGASLGFTGPNHPQACRNLSSAFDAPDAVNTSIHSLRKNGHIHGPFPSPPLPNFRASPLGTVTRKRKTKRRLINHLSWPTGSSVNDGIPDSEAHIHYENFEQAIHLIRSFGRGSLLAKLDLKDAFHHIPVRPQDWHLLGFHWQSNFYYAVVLVFGVKTAPYIFNLFAEALHWIFQRHLPGDLHHYLDDFLLAFRPSTSLQTANRAVTWCQDLCNQLGLSTQEEKTVRPCTCLEFLGLEVDTSLMEARLPIDKLSFLRQTLTDWSSKQTTNLRELQQLTGFLQFASQVIPHSRAFLRRLIDFSTTFRSPFAIRHIPAYAHADIIWWQTFADAWNGKRFIDSSYTTTHVYTDASGTKGLGGIFHPYWYSSRVPRRFRKRDIQFKEIYAVLQAILRWGHLWRHCHVIFHIDNSAIVDALSKETNRSRFTMSIVRLIVMLSASLEFSFSASWLSSSMNFLADSASRFLYSHLFSLSPSLNRQNSSTNPHLVGIKRMLTSRLRSPSSFGTGSPQAQGVPTAPDNAHLLTSSLCTHASSIPTGHTSPPIKQQCLNGSLTSVHRGASSPQQSRHTWVTSKLFTLMPIVPSKLSKPPLHRGSSVVSNATLVTAPANQLPPLPLTSCTVLLPSPSQPPPSQQQMSMQPLNLHSSGSCVQGNLPLRPTSTPHSILPPTLREDLLISTPPSITPPTSLSRSPPPKQILSERELPYPLPLLTPAPVQSKRFNTFFVPTLEHQMPPFSATQMAHPCNIQSLSANYVSSSQTQGTMPVNTLVTPFGAVQRLQRLKLDSRNMRSNN